MFDFGFFNVIEYDEIGGYGRVWLVELDLHDSTPLRVIVLETFTCNTILQSSINRYPKEGMRRRA